MTSVYLYYNCVSIMPSSHHRKDKTRLSCLFRVETVFSIVLTAFRDWTKQFLSQTVVDLSPVLFTPQTPTRQDSLILSMSVV